MKAIKSIALMAALLLCAFGSGCSGGRAELSRTMFIMDTAVTMRLLSGGSEQVLNEAFELAARLDDKLSCYGTGELAQLNLSGSAEVSAELLEAVKSALEVCALSGGAFDITVRPVTALWDFNNAALPQPEALAAAVRLVDYSRIGISGSKIELNGTQLDLGGSAKGYICDKVRDFLLENQVKSAILDFGGNICCIGDKNGAEFNIGIADPDGGNPVEAVKVKDSAVVTSGIYQRFFEVDGVRYHHILNTGSGYPANNELASATVISESAGRSDCLSTAMMALGADGARTLAAAAKVKAVLIFRDGIVEHIG